MTIKLWLECWIDTILIEGDNLTIVGWGFVPNLPTVSQSVYINMNNPSGESVAYSTIVTRNVGVADHFGNELYIHSGFKAVIPMNELLDSITEITINILNGDKLYETDTKMDFSLDDYGYKYESVKTDLSSFEIAPSTIQLWLNCWIDTLYIEDDTLIVGGWGYVPDLPTANQGIYVIVTD